MSIEKVRAYFKEFGREQDILEFDVSSATVALAAKAVGTAPEHIAKTLSFKVENGCVLIVAAGDARIDNRKFKDCFQCKAKMLSPDEVIDFTGHSIGGVCPFAIDRTDVTVYLDKSLKRFDVVYPACGSSNSAIKLNCDELYRYAKAAGWVDVCKLPA